MIQTDIAILCAAQSAVANDNPSNDEEIKDLTTDVRDCVEKLLSTMNARASLLVKAERLELALADAYTMMDIAPYSPLGYLRAGDVVSLRGQYGSAIEMYDDGIERASRSHPHYAQLVKAREAAYEKKNKRIDFISKLPLDVVVLNITPRILQRRTRFHLGKPCTYFDVCRSWRQRLALADGLEYKVGPDDLSKDGYQRVWDLAPFMRSLTVTQPMREILSKITKRPHHRSFNMLKELTIIESMTRGPSSFLASLRSLSSTLTHLNIEYGHRQTTKKRYRLCDVLDACPNLECIRMWRGDLDMSSVSKTYPKMVKMELYDRLTKVYEGDMASVLHPFPQLRVLKLFPVPGSEIFPAVDQCCPLLEQLFLSWESPDVPDLLGTPEIPGLRSLSVLNMSLYASFSEDDMVRYLMKHCDTMEVLDIAEEYGFKAPSDLLHQATSQHVTFKQLRRISYPSDAQEGLVSFLLWIIQHAPHLESIETVSGQRQTRIMQELTQPQHVNLTRLGIQPSIFRIEEEEDLIQHHIDLGQQSNLTELKISVPDHHFYDTWYHLILRLRQLTTLELYTEAVNGFRNLGPFKSNLAKRCPALEQLTMTYNVWSMDINDVDPMYRHKNLKRIVINSIAIHGDLEDFCKRYKKLESLHLKLTKYNWEDIELLDRAPFELVFTPKSTL